VSLNAWASVETHPRGIHSVRTHLPAWMLVDTSRVLTTLSYAAIVMSRIDVMAH
jgi:hypothetical protein